MEESNTGEQLLCKLLNVGAGEWNEAVRFQEVEDALAVERGDDTDMVPKVEAV